MQIHLSLCKQVFIVRAYAGYAPVHVYREQTAQTTYVHLPWHRHSFCLGSYAKLRWTLRRKWSVVTVVSFVLDPCQTCGNCSPHLHYNMTLIWTICATTGTTGYCWKATFDFCFKSGLSRMQVDAQCKCGWRLKLKNRSVIWKGNPLTRRPATVGIFFLHSVLENPVFFAFFIFGGNLESIILYCVGRVKTKRVVFRAGETIIFLPRWEKKFGNACWSKNSHAKAA